MHFFTSDGRIGRSTWWALMLTAAAVPYVPMLISGVRFGENAGGSVLLAFAVSICVGISATIKRLHDLGRPGGLIVLLLIPGVAFFFAIWLGFFPGTRGSNRYGIPHSGSPFARVTEAPALA